MPPWSSWPHEGDLPEVLGPNGSKGIVHILFNFFGIWVETVSNRSKTFAPRGIAGATMFISHCMVKR